MVKRSGLVSIRRPVVYYGYGPLKGLEQFDLAILEPAGWKATDVAHLRSRGVTTLAYVSALEVPSHVVRQAGLRDADLIQSGAGPWYKESLGNWVADPRSPAWRRYLWSHLETLGRQGWQGVFLDTLGDVEDPAVQQETGWLVPQAAELVRMARTLFPSGMVVMNNGLWLLLPLVEKQLDGVAWETTLSSQDLKEPWAQVTLETLLRTRNRDDVHCLLLSHIPPGPEAGAQLAVMNSLTQRFGFLAYAAPADYARAIRLPNGEVVPARHR